MDAAFDLPIQSPSDADRPEEHPHTRASPVPLRMLQPPLPLIPSPDASGPTTARPRPRPRAKARQRISLRPRDPAARREAREAAARTTTRTGSSSPRDVRFLRPVPAVHSTDPQIPKPLLSVTERKSHEETRLDPRARKDIVAAADSRGDIAPDGTSAGREGRQFTVSNVGNNGRIYLRPTVRPAHLRFPPPSFVFPITPPGTAGLETPLPDKDVRGQQQPQQDEQQEPQQQQQEPPEQNATLLYGSDWTSDHTPSLAAYPLPRHRIGANHSTPRADPLRPTTAGGALETRTVVRHRRAVSDSTIQDASVARESDPGGFKVIITQPRDEPRRAKTLEDLLRAKGHGGVAPHLEVAIPTWKLGSPHFTFQGTPVLASSHAPTDDVRSGRRSHFNAHANTPSATSPRLRLFERQHERARGADAAGDIDGAAGVSAAVSRLRLDSQSAGPRTTYHSNYASFEPAMFDALTFKPDCDDRSIVRFSPHSHAITAATPPRLVAEITSPRFMDYDLVSDFFLTFRSFLEPVNLLRMLIARLRWAVARNDETGMVTRVRTFVALRHWILNYFVDDFVVDYELRVLFCNLLNGVVDELSQDPRGRKVELKILTELKKCWRRSCAQYWDGPEFDDALGPDVPVAPGGIAGHRNPSLDPHSWEQVVSGTLSAAGDNVAVAIDDGSGDDDDDNTNFLTHLQSPESMVPQEPRDSSASGRPQTARIDCIVAHGSQPSTPENQIRPSSDRRHASPVSVTSLDFVSCSFPTKNMRLMQEGLGHSFGAPHPVDAGLMSGSTGLVATTPRTLVGKRVRPSDHSQKPSGQGHVRNNSLSDSIRDHEPIPDRLAQKDTAPLSSVSFSGNLVRGAILPPGQPYVDVLPPTTGNGASRQTTLFQPYALGSLDQHKEKASAMSGQGMRKLLGSVRRALSTKGQTVSPARGTYIDISPIGPRGATINRLPGTPIVPQARPRLNGTRPPVRIDLLGAKVAEDFKMAVREEASLETPSPPKLVGEEEQTANADERASKSSGSDSLFFGVLPNQVNELGRPSTDGGMTTGSKSIVIVDGTVPLPPDFPAMAGALRTPNSSVEAVVDTFVSLGADPTPPTTPPGQSMGTPRRSSYILGKHAVRPSYSAHSQLPFVPDMETLGGKSATESVAERPSTLPPVALAANAGIASSLNGVDSETMSGALGDRADSIFGSRRLIDARVDSVGLSASEARGSFGAAASPMSTRRRLPRWVRGHARHQSSRSYQSGRSFGRQNRRTSFTGSGVPLSAVRSFDASTFSRVSNDAVSETNISEADPPPPIRVLRRRPGGDLRAATNIGDLDHGPLRRPRSTGSIATYTESMRSSFMQSQAPDFGGFVDVVSVDYSRGRDNRFSVGMITDKNPRAYLSLFSTHSSKPVMRPSFEAEAQKLAQIPDDVDDDGGVESALLKLEGKYPLKATPRPPSLSDIPLPPGKTRGQTPPPLSGVFWEKANVQEPIVGAEEKLDHRHQHILKNDLAPVGRASVASVLVAAEPDNSQRDASQWGDSYVDMLPPAPISTGLPESAHPATSVGVTADVRSVVSESAASYSSIPLLDRGLTDDGHSRCGTVDEWGKRSVFDDGDDDDDTTSSGVRGEVNGEGQEAGDGMQTPTGAAAESKGSRSGSYELVKKTDSIAKIRPGDTMPPPNPRPVTRVSFLDDESDVVSDMSSEMSVEVIGEGGTDGIFTSWGPQAAAQPSLAASRLPMHALGDLELEPVRTPVVGSPQEPQQDRWADSSLRQRPPSPPITLVRALHLAPKTANIPEVHDHQLWDDKPLPPTPRPTGSAPAVFATEQSTTPPRKASGEKAMHNVAGQVADRPGVPDTIPVLEMTRMFSVHLPFILAFESEVLAQQFTLIEKDALHEIDWKELIDMRWKHAANNDARSWVEYLRSTDARGVEVVIARFNIMVKWAVSQVILTQDVEERARCLIKFIHIAAHCRRMRNYATMSQLTIALVSSEVGRLAKTWQLVPAADERTLRELEALVSPKRNFYSLRAEMEAVGIDHADSGCIPFVGIYTHDLVFNAHRPSEIASSPTTPPLVNFERCRVAASVVKTLLRLVEASALYTFQPIEGITERCLWMSALSDAEIRRYSAVLEKEGAA